MTTGREPRDETVAISATGLTRLFGTFRAVDALDISVRRGEMVALVGPDGAGKTTTIRMLTGVLAPSSGSAAVQGYDLVREIDSIKRRIGYLSQTFSLYGDLSVDENIEFFAQIHNVRDFRRRREELLAFTRLAPFRKRLADRLSGGMKQKLALACTLIHKPDVVFLDEPTTGVDPVSRRDFWLILADLLRQGITIVMATPYLDEAERCHSVALMNDGRVIRRDSPGAIVRAFPHTLLELTCDNPHAAYEKVKSVAKWSGAQMFGARIHIPVKNEEQDSSELRQLLASEAVTEPILRVIAPSLEDAFIEEIRQTEGARNPLQRG
jgi:ABC-2 type transport system ATP-binding protein